MEKKVEFSCENSRVRMNATLTAKGVLQFDITSEAQDVATAKENLAAAIKEFENVARDAGYKIAGKE